MASPASLSQQLSSRWLKEACLQRGLRQNTTPRKAHARTRAHGPMQMAWVDADAHAVQRRKQKISLCMLQTLDLPTKMVAKHATTGERASERRQHAAV